MEICNEFDIRIEGMTLLEPSSNVLEKGPGTRQTCGFLDGTAKDISRSLSISSSGASVSEPAQIQISNGDSRKTAHYEMIALEDISQEQSEEQVSLLMQPTISFISGLVATEQEIPVLSRARTLGSPEESIEISQISHQSTARLTLSICDNLCAHISQSSSIGFLEHTLKLGREP